jgi:hypothetical protein
MPHLWNNILVVTESELVPIFYNVLKTLQSEIDRYKTKPHGIKKVQSGGNGRQLLVSFDSLPAHIQDAIGDPRKHNHILETFYKIDDDAVTFYAKHKIEGQYLKLQHQEEYIINASVLKACVRLKEAREHERRTKKGSLKGVMTSIVKDATSFNPCLKAKHGVQHTLQSSERWFKETFKAFVGEGNTYNYTALISKKHGNANAKKVTDEVVKLLNDLFAGTGRKPTRTEVSRQYDAFLTGYVEVISQETGEVYDYKAFKPLSDNTIINYLGNWEERIGSYSKRSGDRQKLMQQFKPYHSLDMPTYAGSIISIDDRQPPFEFAKSQRAWFYNGIDLASEAFTCWVYGKTKEGIIIDFYRQLVRNYTEWGFRLPAELECESSLNSSFSNTFLRNGSLFGNVRIEANNARGKRIEAYYKPLRYQLEKERSGWLARPFALSESNQKGSEAVPMVPYSQIIEGCLLDIQTWNNMPHSVHKDKTRWEVFCEMQHPELKPTNWKSFLPWLGYQTQTSCNAGIIKLQGKEFLLGDDNEIYLGDNLIHLMKQVEGRSVDAYWLDDNNGGVLKAIIFMGDKCICEALPKPTYNRATIERTEKDEKNRAIMSAYVATIEGYMRRKAASIENVLVIDNRPKTLNNKFVMPGLKANIVSDDETEIMPELPDEHDYVTIPAQSGFVKPLKDRF